MISAYEEFMKEITDMQVKITYLEIENKLLKNNVAIRLNGLDIAKTCYNIAMSYHHGGTCQISNRCRPCVIAEEISEKFGLEI